MLTFYAEADAEVLNAATASDMDHNAGDVQDQLIAEDIEEVVVTGSRLIRSNLDSPSPVTIYNALQLRDTGITTLGEFARFLPQNVDVTSDSRSVGGPFLGSSGFNLRGIGLDGTLTLINGRRIAPFGSTGGETPFVDINSIPVAAIERIEVLKDGASAIYGSEAVAGVVNIITRKDIELMVIEGGYMTTTEGDGAEWDINASGGWSNESTRISGTLSYFERDVIYKRDRDFSSDVDLSDIGGFNGRSTFSSPPTIDLLESGVRLADPECPEQNIVNARLVIVPGALEFCRFNFAQFMTQQNPSDRLGLTVSLDHDFHSELSLFAEFLYSRNDTRSVMAPTPLFGFTVPENHPDNPFGEDLLIRGRTLDTGNRGFNTEVTTWRALTGIRGLLGGWEWEAAVMQSESESDRSRVNAVLNAEFQDALNGLGGPNGDQFYNPFGLNPQNSSAVIDQFLISGTHDVRTTKELTADFQLTGNFWNLPGGPVGAAFGAQARRQSLKQDADEEERTGKIAGSSGFEPINVDRDIFSVFAELLLPLHKTIDLQLALRLDDYSNFGSTTNPKIGLGWRPVKPLLVRATWGTSFRPPTFRELHDPGAESFGFVFEDPHRCPATGDFFDCFGRLVEVEIKGNPDLEPDEGETMLLGVAWEPAFAPGSILSLDFWQIEHDKRVFNSGGFPVAGILFALLDPFTNPFMIRAPQTPEDIALGIPGVIVKQVDTFINGDTLKTNGIDFDLDYVKNTARSGTFSASLSYTYLNEYLIGTDFREAVFEDDFAGGLAVSNALPRHRAKLRVGWDRNAHGFSALIAYAGEYQSPVNLVVGGRQTDTPFIVDDYMQLDLQYRYEFESLNGGMLRIGCRNCTDADPPVFNYGVDRSTEAFHDGRGAMVYLRWSQPF